MPGATRYGRGRRARRGGARSLRRSVCRARAATRPRSTASGRRRPDDAAGRVGGGARHAATATSCRCRGAIPTGCSKRPCRSSGHRPRTFAYRFRVHERRASRDDVVDPYQFGQVLTDFDLHLFAEGTHYRAWEKLGSHRMTIGGVDAACTSRCGRPTRSASASSATSTAGTAASHPMRRLVPSGVWELFIPDLPDGACYKYEVRTTAGHLLREGRSVRAALRGAAEHGVGHLDRTAATSGATRDWMRDRPVGRRLARPADVDLRGAPRIVAPRARGEATAT